MKLLKKSVSLLVFMLYISTVYSQFGVRAKYNLNTFSGFDEFLEQHTVGNNDKIFSSNIELGVDYWFRLKNYRVEFLPEVNMGLKTSSNINSQNTIVDLSYVGFNFNTQIYLFDLEGDCDCPTFSKQGPTLNKSLFFNIAPGVMLTNKEITNELLDPALTSSNINFKIGLGVGYDIGLSDLFTITPMVSYNIAPGLLFNDLTNVSSVPMSTTIVDSSMNQLQFQLRFGFRPDYVKSYGRRR